MAIISLILAACALSCCVYLYLDSRGKLTSEDVGSKLKQYSDELSKDYGRQLRGIEAEWADMYQKFARLSGRLDKVRGIDAARTAETAGDPQPKIPTRHDLLRQRRGGSQRE